MNYVDWDETFMDAAALFAKRSTCVKRQVGAVLVKDKRILGTGYNGTPPGFCNCNEVFEGHNKVDFQDGILRGYYKGKVIDHHTFSERYEIHAEQNCLAFAAKNGVVTDGCTLYVTTAPCVHCAKLIVAAGIKEVIFRDIYKYSDGVDFLNDETEVTVKKMNLADGVWMTYSYNLWKKNKEKFNGVFE